MKDYQPQAPFNVAAQHRTRTITKVNGVNSETFADGSVFYCSAKAWVGSERKINDAHATEETLTIEAWYNSALKDGDHIKLLDDNTEWEIYGGVENINRRGIYAKFKVVRVHG